MTEFEAAKKAYDTARKAAERAVEKCEQRRKALETARSNILLECTCGTTIPVKDVTLVHEYYGGFQPCGYEDWRYYEREYYACLVCHETLTVKGDARFPDGLRRLARRVIDWYSDRERAPDCLTAHNDKYRAKQAQAEKERKIANAERVLRAAGRL